MLARKAISEWRNIRPDGIIFDTKEYGKPYAMVMKEFFIILDFIFFA